MPRGREPLVGSAAGGAIVASGIGVGGTWSGTLVGMALTVGTLVGMLVGLITGVSVGVPDPVGGGSVVG